MKKWLALAVITLTIAGCSSGQTEAEKDAQMKEDIWAASHDGPMPPHEPEDIRAAIASITERSNTITADGSTEADCEPYSDAFDVLSLADFKDERQDYIAPLMNATSQVYSACDGRGTWEGAIDDVGDISELGTEYLDRF